ncbi:MAG: hypothetical protein WC620_07845 [Methanoregula sp.]
MLSELCLLSKPDSKDNGCNYKQYTTEDNYYFYPSGEPIQTI